MHRILLYLGLAITITYVPARAQVPGASPAIPQVRAGTARHPVYEDDARVGRVVKVTNRADVNSPLQGLLDGLGSECGVILLADLDFRYMHLKYASGEQPLRDVLTQVAALLSAQWYALPDRYVLSREAHRASLSAMTFQEASKLGGGAADQLTDSLTPQQWSRVRAGETLSYQDLTPDQKKLASQYVEGMRCSRVDMATATQMKVGDVQMFLRSANRPGPELVLQISGPYGVAHQCWRDLAPSGNGLP